MAKPVSRVVDHSSLLRLGLFLRLQSRRSPLKETSRKCTLCRVWDVFCLFVQLECHW